MAEAGSDEFARQYAPLCKPVFLDLAREALAHGEDADTQARAYAERGKPDFALAYLLLSALPEDERRAIFAQAHLRRAENIDRQAREWNHQFHRPFPLLGGEATRDRMLARRIRDGQAIQPDSADGECHLPLA